MLDTVYQRDEGGVGRGVLGSPVTADWGFSKSRWSEMVHLWREEEKGKPRGLQVGLGGSQQWQWQVR